MRISSLSPIIIAAYIILSGVITHNIISPVSYRLSLTLVVARLLQIEKTPLLVENRAMALLGSKAASLAILSWLAPHRMVVASAHRWSCTPAFVQFSTFRTIGTSRVACSGRGFADNKGSSLITHEEDILQRDSSRKTPFTWPELLQIVEKEKNLAKLCRSVKDQRGYDVHRQELKQNWASIYDFILFSKFGFDRVLVDSRWHSQPRLSELTLVHKSLWLNDFPYYVQDGILHYVLWKTLEDVTEEEIQEARNKLIDTKNAIEIIHWINPPHLKSLPEIDHVHFLCLVDADQQATTGAN